MSESSQMSVHFRPQGAKQISILSRQVSLASFAISSGVLDRSWDAISQTKVHFKDQLSGSGPTIQLQVRELKKCNILAFEASPISKSRLLAERKLDSSSLISGFSFLRSSRRKSSFSIDKTALSLFDSQKDELLRLVAETAEAAKSKPFIITGDGIGGSVACLFALQLLNSLDTTKAKPPLCITFGSPLLGDRGLQEAIKDNTWNSCFLHVVSMDDCFPSLFVQPDLSAGGQTAGDTRSYHPFGRFMFCSNSGSACFENPESALILLREISAGRGRNGQSFDYGSIIASLEKGLVCEDKNSLNANGTGSSRGGSSIAAQYLAALFQLQDVGRKPQLKKLLQNEVLAIDQKKTALEREAKELNEIKEFMACMERYKKISEDNKDIGRNSQLEDLPRNEMAKLDEKREALVREPRALNDIKVYMTFMEWYKKTSEKDKIPYYDSYKKQSDKADFEVNKYKGNLQIYWERKVKEAGEKPQKAEAALRVRWLFGGTNYRRMVEPLVIADYYKREGARGYIKGRPKHYELLEKWFKDDLDERKIEKQNVLPPLLTEDSCFWAHVQEAIISSKILLNNGESASNEIDNLKKFEKYVLELIKKYEVSSDIFWEESSFMKWWKDYEKILNSKLMGTSYTSPLFTIMHNQEYKKYENGELFF